MEPAQDEDDLYDLLHDEIAASRSRPRPGGAEDDEEQRQDTKVRATHPHPHHPRLRATPAQRAARWWRAAAEAGAGGEDGAVRRAAAAGRRPAVAGEPRRPPHGPAAAPCEPGPPAPGQEADAHEGDARRQHLVALQDGGRRDRAERRAEQGAERPVRPPGPLAPPRRSAAAAQVPSGDGLRAARRPVLAPPRPPEKDRWDGHAEQVTHAQWATERRPQSADGKRSRRAPRTRAARAARDTAPTAEY